MLPQYSLFFALEILFLCGSTSPSSDGNVHISYHWHMEQPIYWPAPIPNTPYTYQKAWDSIQLQGQQGGHPQSDLVSIFGDPDRVQGYQYQMKTAIDSCSDLPDMGAQVSFSGELIENLNSLAQAGGQLGYTLNWNATYALERQKLTSGSKTRMDFVAFGYHHPLGPLVDKNALQMELMIHRAQYANIWGSSPTNFSFGFFPSEMAFSERMIPALVQQGIRWVIVANIHLSRACQGYPYSPTGDNMDPPNPADQINPPQTHWWSQSISRGCTPNNAYPFSWQPHYATYVDPQSGNVSRIIVVPADMVQSWWDGYECNFFATILLLQDYHD